MKKLLTLLPILGLALGGLNCTPDVEEGAAEDDGSELATPDAGEGGIEDEPAPTE